MVREYSSVDGRDGPLMRLCQEYTISNRNMRVETDDSRKGKSPLEYFDHADIAHQVSQRNLSAELNNNQAIRGNALILCT